MCRKGLYIVYVIVPLLFIYCYIYTQTIAFYKTYYYYVGNNNSLVCHFLDTYDSLSDIQDTKVEEGSSIFFMETSCNSYNNGYLTIHPRQACAVESAALVNPERMIYMLYLSPGSFPDSPNTQSSQIITALQAYPNIKLLRINMDKFVEGSPVNDLWKSRKVHNGKYPLSHSSDILRYLVLWKYGGIYADLDVIVIKTLDAIPENFAGAQDDNYLASGVMGFSKYGIGHKQVESCLNDLAENYNGSAWINNGPLIVTRLAQRLCKVSHIKNFIGKSCQNFHLFPTDAFYPIYYPSWKLFFNTDKLNVVKNKSKSSYMLHVWNKLSIEEPIDISNDNVPYLHFAKKYCPRTIENVLEYF